jgi:hypothetical protein
MELVEGQMHLTTNILKIRRKSIQAVRSSSISSLPFAPRRKRNHLGHRSTDTPLDFLETPLGHDVIHHPSTLKNVILRTKVRAKYTEAIGMGDRACAHLAVPVDNITVWPSRDPPGHFELDGYSCMKITNDISYSQDSSTDASDSLVVLSEWCHRVFVRAQAK